VPAKPCTPVRFRSAPLPNCREIRAFRPSGCIARKSHYGEETGLPSAVERQAARLAFADLLSIGDEPGEILERFPAVATPPRRDAMPPEMLVRCRRNRA